MFGTIIRRIPVATINQRIGLAGYTTGIYRLPSDSPEKAKQYKEAPIKDKKALLADDEKKRLLQNQSTQIEIPPEGNLIAVNGIPEEHTRERRVRIYIPAKNSMQSGTNNIDHWKIDFDSRERWENPLMGWTSTGDPLSNMQVEFNTKEEAIALCERNGWKWFIDGDEKPAVKRNKNYGINFAWNRRTRVSTK